MSSIASRTPPTPYLTQRSPVTADSQSLNRSHDRLIWNYSSSQNTPLLLSPSPTLRDSHASPLSVKTPKLLSIHESPSNIQYLSHFNLENDILDSPSSQSTTDNSFSSPLLREISIDSSPTPPKQQQQIEQEQEQQELQEEETLQIELQEQFKQTEPIVVEVYDDPDIVSFYLHDINLEDDKASLIDYLFNILLVFVAFLFTIFYILLKNNLKHNL